MRGGILKKRPSNPGYSPSSHILGISAIASSYMSLVISSDSMSKPKTSVDEEPRPVPNSKRPSKRWSIRATFSARRAGWLTFGLTLRMAAPTWIWSVCAATKLPKTSGPGMWLYWSRKWCSGIQTYLNPARSATTDISTFFMIRLCSACGSASRSLSGTNNCAKIPNSIGLPLWARLRC